MASDEHVAMTSERLAEIASLTADVEAGRIHVRFDEETGWLAILDLRREVERLRAREAAALEIVAAVAEAPIEIAKFGTVNKTRMRVLCLRSDVRHVQQQARALLASVEADEQTAPGEP